MMFQSVYVNEMLFDNHSCTQQYMLLSLFTWQSSNVKKNCSVFAYNQVFFFKSTPHSWKETSPDTDREF